MRPEDGRKIYDSVEIPEELKDVVDRAIASKDKEDIRMKNKKNIQKNNTVRIFRGAAAAAAGLLVCLTIGLNTSQTFAMEMSDVPVIGALARVLTVRSWHGTEGDYEINMEVPEISRETGAGGPDSGNAEGDAAETGETESEKKQDTFTGDINAEIQKIVDDYMAQAKTDFEEYREAFFATGGTEEEWADRKMDIIVDYNVKYQQGDILSLELITAKGWVAYQEERHYYNLDLSSDRQMTLAELLGSDYINYCNESIIRQINERIASDEGLVYFGYGTDEDMNGIEGFLTITPETPFYLNEKGNVVIVFARYEVAPGFMGFQEFEIEKPAE